MTFADEYAFDFAQDAPRILRVLENVGQHQDVDRIGGERQGIFGATQLGHARGRGTRKSDAHVMRDTAGREQFVIHVIAEHDRVVAEQVRQRAAQQVALQVGDETPGSRAEPGAQGGCHGRFTGVRCSAQAYGRWHQRPR